MSPNISNISKTSPCYQSPPRPKSAGSRRWNEARACSFINSISDGEYQSPSISFHPFNPDPFSESVSSNIWDHHLTTMCKAASRISVDVIGRDLRAPGHWKSMQLRQSIATSLLMSPLIHIASPGSRKLIHVYETSLVQNLPLNTHLPLDSAAICRQYFIHL